MKNEEQEKEIERLNKRINEYACAWRRQQGIISSLSDALQAQEGITLNNLKDRFTSDGNLNQIHPEELEDYIYKAMK